jgi:hypothetical protein
MTRPIFIAAALALAATLPAVTAQAGAARTFVSAAGSDSNNCINVATPCRHLAAAYAATAASGEIYVLDPANYGSLTITGPVSIEGHGWASIAPPSGVNTAAITINANPGDKINIIGVVLDGAAVGTFGIEFNSGGTLNVRDSVIRDFTGGAGIAFLPNSSTLSQLFVSNTLISDNGSGIDIIASGSGSTTSVLDHVQMEKNADVGLDVFTSSQTINVTVSDSVSAGNGNDGMVAISNGATPVSVMVRNSTYANNGSNGFRADGTGATVRVTRSTSTGNGAGWFNNLGGVILSYGDNNIDGNGNTNTEPPNPLTYK